MRCHRFEGPVIMHRRPPTPMQNYRQFLQFKVVLMGRLNGQWGFKSEVQPTDYEVVTAP